MNLEYFKIVYHYLNYGASLTSYINTDQGFLLKDIISWCLNNQEYQLSDKLIMYIHEKHLDTKENMEKEFIVNSHPYKSFAGKGMLDEYEKYLCYSMKCID